MDWRHRASCRDEDPELFFPVGTSGPALLQAAEARTVCRRCPVSKQCLTWALESGLDGGVFGGLTEDERRAYKRRAERRARIRTSQDKAATPRSPTAQDRKPPAGVGTQPAANADVEASPRGPAKVRGPRRAVIARLVAGQAALAATAAEKAHAAVAIVNERGKDPRAAAEQLGLAEWDVLRWLSRAARGEPLVQPPDKSSRPRTGRRPRKAA